MEREPTIRAELLPPGSDSAEPFTAFKEMERALCAGFEEQKRRYRSRLADKIWALRKRAFQAGFRSGQKNAEKEKLKCLLGFEWEHRRMMTLLKEECQAHCLTVLQHYLEQQAYGHTEFLAERIRRTLSTVQHLRGLRIEVSGREAEDLRESLARLSVPVHTSHAIEPGTAKITSPAGEITVNWREDLSSLCQKILQGSGED